MHYDFHHHNELVTENFWPEKEPVTVLITSGASCPDAVVEGVIKKLAGFYPTSFSLDELTTQFQ
jgi:4-hydroxy-3-methylbut-2-en-1-yl diphosphate reductase